jgi:hypothetical protein
MIPSVRSRSPIAERDQRLSLTDADWNFEVATAGDDASPMPGSIDPSADARLTASDSDAATPTGPSLNETPSVALPTSASAPPRLGSLRTAPLISPELPSQSPTATEPQTDASVFSAERSRPGSATHAAPSSRSGPRERAVRADALETSPSSATPACTVSPLLFANEPTQTTSPLEETMAPRDPYRRPTEFRWKEAETPSPRAFTPPRVAVVREHSPPIDSPRVIIERIDVEVVVPPAAEKPGAKPPRSGAVSQIGPLGGVAKHLVFSVRHR